MIVCRPDDQVYLIILRIRKQVNSGRSHKMNTVKPSNIKTTYHNLYIVFSRIGICFECAYTGSYQW